METNHTLPFRLRLRHVFWIVGIIIVLLVNPSFGEQIPSKTCDDCIDGCEYVYPAGDGCNTCTRTVTCIDGKWYKELSSQCTLMACVDMIEIPNPFKGE